MNFLYDPTDPYDSFSYFSPIQQLTDENGFPDRYGCLMAIGSWVVLILIFVILSFCTSCRSVATPTVVELHDSAGVYVQKHVVYVPDTVPVLLPPQTVEHITPDTISVLSTDYATSTAAIRGGMLHHTLTTTDKPVPVPVQHREITRDSIVYREREVPVPVPVVQEVEKPLSSWQQLRLWLGNIVLVALALTAAVWLLRRRAWWTRLFRR